MSKMDNLRALREARYEQDQKARPTAEVDKPAASRRPRAVAKAPTAVPEPAEDRSAAPSDESLCGHRAISGRTCTRPLRHTEKNHRYA